MKRPEDVQLSREEGEALLARLEANTLTAEDRRVLGKVLTFYFWLLFALREAKLSLKRVKALVFGEKPKKPKPPSHRVGRPAEGVQARAKHRPGPHKEGQLLLPRRRPRRNRLHLGMGGTGPTCIGRRRRWRAAMRSWPWASGVRRVGGGGCIAYRPGLRCGWTVRRCSRRCAMRWRSFGVPPAGKSSPRPCPSQQVQRNTLPGRGRC